MTNKPELNELIQDVLTLVKKEARGNPKQVRLSQETSLLLDHVGLSQAASSPAVKMDNDAAPETRGHLERDSSFRSADPDQAVPESADESAAHHESASKISDIRTDHDSLAQVAAEIADCQKCPLSTTRLNTVPGEGSLRASLVFVGEAPGASEDREGRPFVGRAGQLLTDIICKGMKMKREDVFICNVLKCRPPENRTPNPEEVLHCEPYLLRQLECIRPKIICALGLVAAQTLLKTTDPIYKLRGRWFNYHGVAFRVTYHPAYLLRNPADKAKAWEDVKEILRYLKDGPLPEVQG